MSAASSPRRESCLSPRLRRRRPFRSRSLPRIEALEERKLLSISSDDPGRWVPEGAVPIAWQGVDAYAEPGQWIARFDGLSGSPQEQVGVLQERLRGTGLDLEVEQYLGLDGLVELRVPE